MKRYMICAGLLVAALGFTACDEDFTDWADPQTNPQLDPTQAVTAVIEPAATGVIAKETSPATVDLVRFVSAENVQPGSTVKFTSLKVNGDYALPFVTADSVLAVSTASLDSIVQLAYASKAHVERGLTLAVTLSVVSPAGQALAAEVASNEVAVRYLPASTPAAESAYYILGDFCGWTADTALPMTDKGGGVFEADIEATADSWYKFFPASAITTDVDWNAAIGSDVDGDTSAENFLVWDNAQALKVGAGKYRVSIDVVNWRFTVKAVADELYMTGSAYGWTDWNQLVPVYGEDGHYWMLTYLAAGDEFKFAPQAGWGGDFGADQLSFVDNAGAGLSGTGNVVVGNSGWYLLYVDAVNKVLETYSPQVYLIGECAGSWDVSASNLFSVPADADGDFVSPAFVADNEIRVCVHPKESIDWWKMEFIVFDGRIAYRGNGGDQDRVQGKAGQKLYLNFTKGTGEIK